MLGTIVKGISGFYYVEAEDGNLYECKARGVFKKRGIVPLAGDKVDISVLTAEEGWVEKILPRINSFDRPPVANVEIMVVVSAVRDPDPNFGVIDRFCVAGELSGAEIVLCVNKSDLASTEDLDAFRKRYEGVYPLCFVSARTGAGTDDLRRLIGSKQSAFAGPSGAGKSTLTNVLLGEKKSETGEISQRLMRGKNTTRHSELFCSGGLRIFDTPGFTSFETADAGEDELAGCFPEFREYVGLCRFNDCRHIGEPDCAVADAVAKGRISAERYASYKDILGEIKERKKYQERK